MQLSFPNENGLVEVSSQVANDAAVISVRDKGIGISEEDQAHLFSTFFRGRNALNIQGYRAWPSYC
jgi:signal transduction histidine kinase